MFHRAYYIRNGKCFYNLIFAICNHTEKYRLQSDRFESISVILLELIDRLEKTCGKDIVIKYADELPIDNICSLIDKNFEVK